MQSRGAYRFGAFEFHPHSGRLLENGRTIALRPKVFYLLCYLVENPGRLITKEELLDQVWPETAVSESTLSSTVFGLRNALGDNPRKARYLETVPKRGYRFTTSVEKLSNGAGEPEGAKKTVQGTPQPPGNRRRLLGVPLRMATLLTLGLVAGGWLLLPHFISTAEQAGASKEPGQSASGEPETDDVPEALIELNHIGVWPDISPDGEWIAFSWEGPERKSRNIYLLSSRGGEPVQLTDDPNPDWAPVWSPDGQAVAFMRSRFSEDLANSKDILLIRPFEGHSERLLHRLHPPQQTINVNMAWGREGLFFAARQTPEDLGAVYLLNIESGGALRYDLPILAPPIIPVMAAPSPSGRGLALVGEDPDGRADIYLLAPFDGSIRRLTFHQNHIWGLAWVKGGEEIVYATFDDSPDTESRLWAVSPRHGSPRILQTGIGFFPRASQEGSLVYERSLYRMEIIQLDAESGRTSAYLPSERIDYYPQFSPDAQMVAFVSSRSGEFQIWLAEQKSRQCRPLIELSEEPSWSPDGRRIAFTSRHEDQGDIYITGLDGAPPIPVTLHKENDAFPSWSRDGKWIYYASHRSGAIEVWKSPVEGGEPIQITRTGGTRPLEGPAGRFLYYQKPKRNGIWRCTTDGLDETLIVEEYDDYLLGAWAVVEQGIYYAIGNAHSRYVVKFHDFKAGKARRIGRVDRYIVGGAPSLTVSPDEKTILLTVGKPDKSEIVVTRSW